jgi:uncharacterized protein (UPF0333 family)
LSVFVLRGVILKSKSILLKKSKAQVSVEYLVIIGISLALLVPGGYFFYNYSRTSNEGTIRSQISQIGSNIIVSAESIYGLADGSMVTIDLRYPNNIREIYFLDGKELVIKYELSGGINEAVFFSKINLAGNYIYPTRAPCATLPTTPCENSTITNTIVTAPGSHKLKFESRTNYILVTQVK